MTKWIRVKDRLPDNRQDVIVYNECKEVCGATFFAAGPEWDYSQGNQFTVSDLDTVTHWMPFPNPPEED